MPRIMIDSIRGATIRTANPNPEMIAGYVDEYSIPKWTAVEWAMFPRAVKVRIAKKASTNDGHVLDVEDRLATPQQAPGWVKMRRQAGLATPAIYVQKSSWGAVQAEFQRQGVAQPLYFIAHYNGVKELPVLNGIQAIAKQYLGDVSPGVDYSYVADYWPGVDSAPVNNNTSGVDMTGVNPRALPYSFSVPNPDESKPGLAFEYYPIECGTNSTVIARQWMVLNSAFGPTEYEIVIVGKDGTLVAPKDGWSPTSGTIADRGRVAWEFKDGTVGVALKYKNAGSDWTRAGVSFPFASK